MKQSPIVVHALDGTIRKGVTSDFFPNKDRFHLQDGWNGGEISEVGLRGLKAVFFVKTLEGNPAHQERDDLERAGYGRRVRVRFKDGETRTGYTQGYAPTRPGFFFFPSDPESNNERVFVLNAATEEVQFI